jgi:uncharacterized membrane protein
MNNLTVTESAKNIRALGFQALKGNWIVAIEALVISTLLVSIPAFLIEKLMQGDSWGETFLLNVETFLIGGPVTLGLAAFMLLLFRKYPVKINQLFDGFEHFTKAVLLMLVTSIFIMLWTFCFIIPGIIAAIRYSQAFYILADDPSKGVMQCLEESKWMMRGNKYKFFCLLISFLGWAILAAIPVGIGFLWLLPYISMSQVVFYELVSGNLKPEILEENNDEA